MCERLKIIDKKLNLDFLLEYIEGNCKCEYCIKNLKQYEAVKIIVKFLKSRISIKKKRYGRQRESCYNCISDISRNILIDIN